MDSTLDDTQTTMMTYEEDNYDEPIWKSKQNRSFVKQTSYSRKNVSKFLDKDLGERNRELYLDLFNQDPNKTVCDKAEYEKELFADIEVAADKQVRLTKKKTTKKKQKAKESPEFLSDQYQHNLEKQKAKLQDIFEKSSVYQNLQALKDTPLNIQTVDQRGKVVKRFQYFYDYEENKHDIIEVKNDEEEEDHRMEAGADSSKQKNYDSEEVRDQKRATKRNSVATESTIDKLADESEPGTPRSRKRKMHFDDLNDDSFSSFRKSAIKSTSTPTLKRRLAKIDEQGEAGNKEEIDKSVLGENLAEETLVNMPASKSGTKNSAKSKAKSSNTGTSTSNSSKIDTLQTNHSSKVRTSSKCIKETVKTKSTRPRRSSKAKN